MSTPPRKVHRSLVRRQLLALLMVLCVPYVIILGLSARHQSVRDHEAARTAMLRTAVKVAERLDDHVADLSDMLSILSVVVGTERSDTLRNDALLHDLADHLPPQVNNINVWAADGTNIGSLRPEVRSTGLVVSERQFFRDAADRAGLAVEAPLVSPINGQRIGVFGLRIEREGRFVGVVAVSARLQRLQDLLSPGIDLATGNLVVVTNEQGVVVAHSGDAAKWIGQSIADANPQLASARQQREGVYEGDGAEGERRIAGFTVATRVPWLVYVDQPTADVFGPARTRLLDQIAIGGVLMIVGLLVAHWISELIARPLRRLEEDAMLLEAGQLSHRSAVTGSGEIGSLAATLNRMAQSLEQRTQLLEASEERLRRLAHYDALTGLVNRSLFMERLNALIDQSERQRRRFTLLFLDVDHFKSVNDTHGHRAGDEVLIGFARALEGQVGPDDTVARLAGDEFMVILPAVDDFDVASSMAQRLVDAVKTTVGAGRRVVAVSASVGVAMFEFGENGSSLLNRADEALYMAKRMGRDRVRIAFRSESRKAEVVATES